MRICANCYNAHYNMSNGKEELYCDESEFIEEPTKEESSCEYHRYFPGMEEEMNYLYYDNSYLSPGFLIVNVEDGKMKKYMKIYNARDNGMPLYGIRAYSLDAKEDPNESFSKIDFTFRDFEDYENGLYDCFTSLCNSLSGNTVFSTDSMSHGKNHFKLNSNSRVTTISIFKDTYHGLQHPTDYIDILLGDEYSCNCFLEINAFYQKLSRICRDDISSEKTRVLLLSKNT